MPYTSRDSNPSHIASRGHTMTMRRCTCGAEADVQRQTRRTADGHDEIVYLVICPVCGQRGPAVPAAGRDEAQAIAEAIEAWNAMIAQLRPLEE